MDLLVLLLIEQVILTLSFFAGIECNDSIP